MQRTGLVHVSSMMAVATPRKPLQPDHTGAPWNTHWTVTCDHQLVPRLKKYASGVRAKKQCVKCGQGVGQNVSMAGVVELWDEDLELRVRSEYDAACAEYRQANDDFYRWQRGEKSREWWSLYEQYMRSAVWQTKRELVLERCGGVCESCGQADAQHVHHLKYPDTFGLEPLWDLRGVCVPCHKIIHPHMR
jgi:hypothetical protein